MSAWKEAAEGRKTCVVVVVVRDFPVIRPLWVLICQWASAGVQSDGGWQTWLHFCYCLYKKKHSTFESTLFSLLGEAFTCAPATFKWLRTLSFSLLSFSLSGAVNGGLDSRQTVSHDLVLLDEMEHNKLGIIIDKTIQSKSVAAFFFNLALLMKMLFAWLLRALRLW